MVVCDVHPVAFFATMVCELPAANEPYVRVALNAPPSKLYVSPDTPVMVIEPVATVQLGCVGVADGADGPGVTANTTSSVTVQPRVVTTVKRIVAGAPVTCAMVVSE